MLSIKAGAILLSFTEIPKASPKFSVELTSQEVLEGSVAKFYCKALGIPPPVIIWYKSGDVVRRDEGIEVKQWERAGGQESTLVVLEVTDEKGTGLYRAEAVNQYGSDFTEALLMGRHLVVPGGTWSLVPQ